MAELKAHDYGYTEPLIEQPQPNKSAQTPPERPEIIEVPHSPARRLKRISKLEKLIGAILFAAIIGLAVLTIYVRTDISQLEHDVSLIQAETTQQNEETTRLEQEKSELSKTERIKKVAEKQGLTINDDNLRKVK
ncbi:MULTISPECIES: cell division protein FtsL [Enterococcus]|uniref:cell division protein FtsL n=1 Tax=Enterococcus TaxID=1350 RepID=UPI00065E233C|nr:MULTISPECIES: cell division protein FtsL [Enterococcus]KAF1301343.1 cell division protein FtsL [Enterococcus sp. JM9B]